MRPSGRAAGAVAAAGAVGLVAVRRSRAGRAVTVASPESLHLAGGVERTMTVSDGASLVMTDVGEGQLVLMAHGWTEVRGIWRATAEILVSAGYRVVAYDQRGHGRSSVGADGISIERLGRDMAEILDGLDARSAVVVGHSMGGMSIMSMAGVRPDAVVGRVAGALLVSTTAGRLSRAAHIDPVAAAVIGSGALTRLFSGPAGRRLVRRSLGRQPAPAHALATAAMFASTSAAVRRDCFMAMATMDLRHALTGLGCPVTVAVGGLDHLTPPKLGRRIAEAVPGARFVVIPDAGHQLPFERPDRVAELVFDLARSDRASVSGPAQSSVVDTTGALHA